MKHGWELVLAAAIPFMIGCKTAGPVVRPVSCITQPFADIRQERSKTFDIAAKLEKVPIDANLKANFTDLLQQNFASLSDKNISQMLFLQAIDCYMLRAAEHPELLPLVEAVVKDMSQAVLRAFSASQGISGATERLDDNQIAAIMKSPYGPMILARYRSFGIR